LTMPRLFLFFLIVVILLSICERSDADNDRFGRKSKSAAKAKAKAAPVPTYNTNLIPSMEEMLKSINLEHRAQKLYKMGFVDMRVLLRAARMDYQLMRLNWEDSTDEEIQLIRETVEKMAQLATVVEEEVEKVDYTERNKLSMGRLHIPGSVQAFEYLRGSFGGVPPIGLREVVLASNEFGCTPRETADLVNKIYVVKRGFCTFLEKALVAHRAGAVGLVIVNSEDRVDNVASGYGIDKNITEQALNEVANLAIISLSNVTWAPIAFSARNGGLFAQMIPVKCQSSATCQAVIDEEKGINLEVSSGHIRVSPDGGTSAAASFDFLTSTFGGRLLNSDLIVRIADPIDACEPLVGMKTLTQEADMSLDGSVSSSLSSRFAVYARRGTCKFDVKAQYAQEAGADLLIVADINDDALQRLGAGKLVGGLLGIPGILVTSVAGEYIEETARESGSVSVSLTTSKDDALTKAWIDLAFLEWGHDESEALLNINGLIEQYTDKNSQEIVSWLGRKAKRIADKSVKIVDVV
jgi:hypothetical protein